MNRRHRFFPATELITELILISFWKVCAEFADASEIVETRKTRVEQSSRISNATLLFRWIFQHTTFSAVPSESAVPYASKFLKHPGGQPREGSRDDHLCVFCMIAIIWEMEDRNNMIHLILDKGEENLGY